MLHHSSITKTENKNVDEVYPTADEKFDFPPEVPCKEISRHEDARGGLEGDDVIWMPELECSQPEENITADAAQAAERAQARESTEEPGRGSDKIASKNRKNKIVRPHADMLVSEESVATRTRSRKEKYQANMLRNMIP